MVFLSGQLGRYFLCPPPEHRLTAPADRSFGQLAAQLTMLQVNNLGGPPPLLRCQPLFKIPVFTNEPGQQPHLS